MIDKRTVARIIDTALAEDMPFGDLTSEYVIDPHARGEFVLVARECGVMAGAEFIGATFTALDPDAEVLDVAANGASFAAGERLARIAGSAQAILSAERTCLNLVQRACGIATLTAHYVEVAREGSANVRVVDTRKTAPGLRALDKAAVAAGGGHNHRFGLSDAIMLKDNHLAVLAASHSNLSEALLDLRSRVPHTTHIEVEIDSLSQLDEILAGCPDTIMLDNFSEEDLREAVRLIGGRALTEASGGVNLDTITGIAATGVDIISVGALTHGVRNLDLGLDDVESFDQ